MTARRALAPAILFAVFLSLPATPQIQSNPPPSFPRSDDERALSDLQLLGKRLFEDANLSEPKGQACSSCHDPKRAFQGNNGSPIAAVAALRGSGLPWLTKPVDPRALRSTLLDALGR